MDLYREGVPLTHIQQMLGHENISTTSGFYAFATLDVLANALEVANPDKGIKTWSDPVTLEKLYKL
jgi:site-specific recombinase XerD